MEVLKDKTIAIIGYGSQGHSQAQNLRDSGLKVVVGLKEGNSWKKAKEDDFSVYNVGEAVAMADIVQILLPDEKQAKVYQEEIVANLQDNATLFFSHGFNIHYGQIVPPINTDVVMIAPKSPGHLVRRTYREGAGVPGLVAIHQDYSGKARETALAYAKGIGCTRAGVIETTFKEETETDLFGEQAVLCGGVTELVKAGFDTLTDAGYQPEIAYFECLHELKLIVDLMYEGGLSHMRYSISDTAQYGDFMTGKRIITEETRSEMARVLKEIQTGQFAKSWILENQVGKPVFNAIAEKEQKHEIEEVGKRLREMMPFVKAK